MRACSTRILIVAALACSLEPATALLARQLHTPSALRHSSPSACRPVGGCENCAATSERSSTGVLRLCGGSGTRADRAVSCFRRGATRRERWLGIWLLLWNVFTAFDAAVFAIRMRESLDSFLDGGWGPHTFAVTRFLINSQIALVLATVLIALRGDETLMRSMFGILLLNTLGSFRAVYEGIKDRTVKAPWKAGYALVMTTPPVVLLAYFAFLF